MGNESGTFLGSNTDHLLGDAGTCHRCSKQVPSFIDGITFKCLEDVICYEFFTQVGNYAFDCTGIEGLGFDCLEVFVVLAYIGAEGDDLEALLAEPFEDEARTNLG